MIPLRLLLSTAQAQTAAQSATSSTTTKPSILETLFPFAIILVFFYLFLGRPQQKKMREQQAMLGGLKRGDQVVTTGGVIGEITGLTEKFVTLQIADNVRIKVVRMHVSGLASKEGNP
jgi:preprotein translocase subunit YajC